jgi:hypothetical protein
MYQIGQEIAYVLLPKDRPTDPTHEYHGVILAIYVNQIQVQLIDAAYTGLVEWISELQIIKNWGAKRGAKPLDNSGF